MGILHEPENKPITGPQLFHSIGQYRDSLIATALFP